MRFGVSDKPLVANYTEIKMPKGRTRASALTIDDGPLVWVDLEMTGLDFNSDRILEIAIIITDSHLNPVDDGLNLIVNQPKSVLDNMNEWCIENHSSSGLTKACLNSETSGSCVASAAFEYIRRWIPEKSGVIAGNTVHVDLKFLAMDCYDEGFKRIADYLHYRVLDVSTLKEIVKRWYPSLPQKNKNLSKHRALDDIKDSIDELKYYKTHIFKPVECDDIDIATPLVI